MLGIVILNYNNYQETILCANNCIHNIENGNHELKYKIYIVDNCSPNESFHVLSKEFTNYEQIDLIQSDKNGGFSYGNNIGFRAAIFDGCDSILCTNSDVEFCENSILSMLKTLEENNSCAVVGPKVYCADGSLQNTSRGVLTSSAFIMHHRPFLWFDWFGINKKYTYANYKYDKAIKIDGMVSGCCFLIRAAVLVEIGYLDENVFLYHEEDILGAKLREKGYCVILEPSAEIIHLGGKSTPKNSGFIRYHTFYSALYYLWNYGQASKCAFNFTCFYVKSIFFLKGISKREYREYYKKIKIDIKRFKKSKRLLWKK